MYGDSGRVLNWMPLEQPTNGNDVIISVATVVAHFESLYSVSCSALAATAGKVVLDCVTAL